MECKGMACGAVSTNLALTVKTSEMGETCSAKQVVGS